MTIIESLEEWNEYARMLAEFDYRLYQMQYDARSPEGFHARFWADESPTLEVMTHNEAVQDAIVKYKP